MGVVSVHQGQTATTQGVQEYPEPCESKSNSDAKTYRVGEVDLHQLPIQLEQAVVQPHTVDGALLQGGCRYNT